jgi:predicted ArsR family transcriptional regulator
MISCTEFIPAYSELFKFLEDRGGKQAVEDFWRHLAERFLGNLKSAVEAHGLRGCWLYWSRTLNEEAADFTMELDEEAGQFKIIMHHCPSMGGLLELEHVEPYHDYCRHCEVLYKSVLEPLGYEYSIDLSSCREARCSLTLRRRQAAANGMPGPQ